MSSGPPRAAASRASGLWSRETRDWASPSHWKSLGTGSASGRRGHSWRPGSGWIPERREEPSRGPARPGPGAPAGSRKRASRVLGTAMTAVLIMVLVLALWLAVPSGAAADRRTRRALTGVEVQDPAARGHRRHRPRSAGWGSDTGNANRRTMSGLGRWLGGSSAGRGTVPMTVVVQQLAALSKGGRTPARLWDELWVLYGGEAEQAAVQGPASGMGRDGTGRLAAPVLARSRCGFWRPHVPPPCGGRRWPR